MPAEMSAAEAAERIKRLHYSMKLPTLEPEDYEALAFAFSLCRKVAEGEYRPVTHGRWIHTSEPNEDGMGGWHDVIQCTACHEDYDGEYDYCPSCGALMDGKDGEKE